MFKCHAPIHDLNSCITTGVKKRTRFRNVSKVHCIPVIVLPCQLNEEPLAMSQESPTQELLPLKKRRTRIPDKPNYSLNLWSIMKNCIGKELSKIPMPVILAHD